MQTQPGLRGQEEGPVLPSCSSSALHRAASPGAPLGLHPPGLGALRPHTRTPGNRPQAPTLWALPKPLTKLFLLFRLLSLRLISLAGLALLHSAQGQLSSVEPPQLLVPSGQQGIPSPGPSSSRPASPGSRVGPGMLGRCPAWCWGF